MNELNVTFMRWHKGKIGEKFSAKLVTNQVPVDAAMTLIKMPLDNGDALIAHIAEDVDNATINGLRRTLEHPWIAKGAKVIVVDATVTIGA